MRRQPTANHRTFHTAQGYALVEYETRAEAEAAIAGATGSTLLEQMLTCDFAFVRPTAAYVSFS